MIFPAGYILEYPAVGAFKLHTFLFCIKFNSILLLLFYNHILVKVQNEKISADYNLYFHNIKFLC